MLFPSRHRPRGLALSVGLCVTVAMSSLGALAFAGTASAASTASVFYLDIGGSGSVGVQPTMVQPRGEPTSSGYANDLVTLQAERGISLSLVQTGCPGESTTTMLYGGDHCYLSPTTQLTTAVAFLQAHVADRGIVSVDLGFNNVVKCVKKPTGTAACLSQGFALVRQELPQILATLTAAAGPDVHFVGVGHYDPFLASALHGVAGRATALKSVSAMATLNRTLATIYQSFSIPTANVAKAFQNFNRTPTTLAGFGVVATNVAETCALTWMCQLAPFGPNLHPNDVGYQTIAEAIADALPTTL